MWRIMLCGLALISVAQAWSAEPPRDRPQHERTLKEEQRQRVEKLGAKVESAQLEADFPAAVRAAEEIVELRTRDQGADHWETRDSRSVVVELKRLPHSREQRQHMIEADRLARQANEQFARGAYQAALAPGTEALATRRKVLGNEHHDTVTSLNTLGTLKFLTGDLPAAEELLKEALRIRRVQSGDWHPLTALGCENLAALRRQQGQVAEAEKLYREALAIRRDAYRDDHVVIATTLFLLAELHKSQGDLAAAKPLHEEALQIRLKSLPELHSDIANSHYALADIYRVHGQFAKVESSYKRASYIYRRNGLLRECARCMCGLADFHASTGLRDHALRGYSEAEKIVRELGGAEDPDLAGIQLGLATVYLVQKRPEKAEEAAANALRICEREFGAENLNTLKAANNLAVSLHEQGKLAAAAPLYQKAANTCHKLLGLDHLETTFCLYNLANIYICLGEHEQALEVLEDAVRSFEGARRKAATGLQRSMAAARASPYPLQAACFILLNRPREAFQALEFNLGRALLDELQARGDASAAPKDLASIQAALPPDGALVLWLDVSDAAEQMQEHWGCVVRSTGLPQWERLPGSGDGGRWIPADTRLRADLRAGLAEGTSSLADCERLSRQLHAQRLAPLEKHLVNVRQLFVVPVGAMGAIPLEVLTNRFLIHYVPSGSFLARSRKPNATINAEGILALGDPQFAPPPGVQPKVAWPQIPAARVEVDRIARLFPIRSKALLGSDASEPALEALRNQGDLAKYRYLHFATHGQANNSLVLESALILAQDGVGNTANKDPASDGSLTAHEVLTRWQLNAELVTLSACETALGRHEGGDGRLGFAQSFLAAGARTVCLTQWKVDDFATTMLMVRFYENLAGRRPGLSQPMPKAAALAEAKQWLRNLSTDEKRTLAASLEAQVADGQRGKGEELNVIKSAVPVKPPPQEAKPYAHPRFWAAFILIGDAS